VELGRPDPAAEWRPDRDLGVVAPSRAEPVPRELRPDLVKRLVCESEKLDLGDRDHAADRESERGADNRRFRQGGVHHPLGPVRLHQPARHPEDAAEPADVHAEQHHSLIARHLVEQRAPDCFEDRELWLVAHRSVRLSPTIDFRSLIT
jgi:hypothetical protein